MSQNDLVLSDGAPFPHISDIQRLRVTRPKKKRKREMGFCVGVSFGTDSLSA